MKWLLLGLRFSVLSDYRVYYDLGCDTV
jgi:hypothetical protein